MKGGFVLAKRKRNQKVVRMKEKRNPFAGLLLITFAIYLFVLFIQSVTREHVSIYEVTEKQIADDEVLRGIVLRDEILVKSDEAGYINYYVGEGARIGCNTTVYSIDKTGQFADDLSALDMEDIALSEEDTREIRNDIASHRNGFDLSDYQSIVNFKYNIDNTLLQMTTVNLLQKLNKVMDKEEMADSLKLVKSDRTGIISFCSDGLEDFTIDDINKDTFKDTTDKWKQLRSSGRVESGGTIYKLINSDDWSIVVPITKEQYNKIYDKETIPVTLKKDNQRVVAKASTFTEKSEYYLKLDLSKYMIKYLDNRYLDVEIEFNSADGLKIPTSSVLEKKFYVIPSEYITKGGDSGRNGVMVLTYKKDGSEETTFVPAEVYEENEDAMVYIDANLFEPGTKIVRGASSGGQTMEVTQIAKLEGVYNCNQGFCEFRKIEKLYENDEYAIVSKDTEYGLSSYDHIILNPDMIEEEDVIY